MDVKCPHCGTEYEVEKEDMYRHTECEVCGKGFVIGATASQKQNAENATTNASGEGSVSDKVKEAAKAVADAAVQKVRNVDWKQQGERAKGIAKKMLKNAQGMLSNAQGTKQYSEEEEAKRRVEGAKLLEQLGENEYIKAWGAYWLARLVVCIVFSLIFGVAAGFVYSITRSKPFSEWPIGTSAQGAHVSFYLGLALAFFAALHMSWLCYKRFAVRKLIPDCIQVNLLSSWIVPTVINVALSMLMPGEIQLAVLGVYGCIVWGLTIWIVVDYCMFRFISVRLLCGQKIDGRWICPAILFCVFIVSMYGFAQIASWMDRVQDAVFEIDRTAEHIYERMGRMKLY